MPSCRTFSIKEVEVGTFFSLAGVHCIANAVRVSYRTSLAKNGGILAFMTSRATLRSFMVTLNRESWG